jgi:hypothetical protein
VLVMQDGQPVMRTHMLWGFPKFDGKGPYATNFRHPEVAYVARVARHGSSLRRSGICVRGARSKHNHASRVLALFWR